MLRISRPEVAADGTKLRLDGKLAGPWVQELQIICEPILAKGGRIQIDCSGILSVDDDGVALMRALQSRGATLVDCSGFIRLRLGRSPME